MRKRRRLGDNQLPALTETVLRGGEVAEIIEAIADEVAGESGLPIVKLATAPGRIRDRIFQRRLTDFIASFRAATTEEQYSDFRQQYLGNQELVDRTNANLWQALDRLDDIAKTPLLGRAFAALVRKDISYAEFLTLVAAIDRCVLSDLSSLTSFKESEGKSMYAGQIEPGRMSRLQACGLIAQTGTLQLNARSLDVSGHFLLTASHSSFGI